MDKRDAPIVMVETLGRAIARRSKYRALRVDFARMRYLNSLLFNMGLRAFVFETLYVGVGHGHDALLSIADNQTERVIGVDPYIGGHGNNDEGFRLLLEIIDELELAEKFTVKRMFVQAHLDGMTDKVDRIICNDVLHHIFVTSDRLTKSDLYSDAVELFAKFRDAITDDGVLVVADVGRHGLRQYLHGVARPLGFAGFREISSVNSNGPNGTQPCKKLDGSENRFEFMFPSLSGTTRSCSVDGWAAPLFVTNMF
jgi:hypothetical protein